MLESNGWYLTLSIFPQLWISIWSVQITSMPKERECCLPKSVTFQDYEDHLGMSLFCKALCFSAFTAVVQEVFAKHQDPPIVKANNRALNYILLIFIFPCFLYPFLFIDHPKTATCIPHQMTLGDFFLLWHFPMFWLKQSQCGSGLQSHFTREKDDAVFGVRGTKCRHSHLLLYLTDRLWTLSGTLLSLHWHRCTHWMLPHHHDMQRGFDQCLLLCFLALGSFSVALLTRNWPNAFNEAKFLAFSLLVFRSVWVTFLPACHSVKENVPGAVEAFSISASSAGLLICIFPLKCYIIF